MIIKHRLKLSYSYFRKHLNRYVFLLISLSLGFAVITIVSSLSAGMSSALSEAARSHYGGDLFVISYDKSHGNKMHMSDPSVVEEALAESGIKYSRLQKRVGYYRDSVLYHEGESAGQKNVYGVDWENEDFSHLNIVGGSLEELGEGSIMISEAVAAELGCGVGDEVVLSGSTLTGQRNTLSLRVGAIFRDTSIFGYYKSYTGIDEMRRLMAFEDDAVSQFGIYLDGDVSREDLSRFHQILSGRRDCAPLLENKEDLTYNLDGTRWKGQRLFLIPLGIFVSQVDEMLIAMDLITYFLYAMVALIILVSVFISYQMVIRERQAEIGTLRAIGMDKKDVMSILALEALWLYVLGILSGALLSIPGFAAVAQLPYDAVPGFELFLKQGRLVPEFSALSALFNMGLLALILLPAALVPSFRASRTVLTEALA